MNTDRSASDVQLLTIPSSDTAFRAHVDGLVVDPDGGPAALERRLRRVFPRVVVRERALSGEGPAWYVYRDGGWRSPPADTWWDDPALPRVVLGADGWLTEVNPTAGGLLGIDPAGAGEHHFTDFSVAGTIDQSMALFGIIASGSPMTATVLLKPVSGDVIAVDFRAWPEGDGLVAVFRLATDVDIPTGAEIVTTPVTVTTTPATDVAFRAYVLRALARMAEPTVDGLALRVRRLYPHAAVQVDGESWLARRDGPGSDGAADSWWLDTSLPRVRYDAQALILEANDAARQFLGRELVGHYWQDFVTPGSTDEVEAMLEILSQVGAAESRFRMPRADGSLVEFHSYTTVTGEEFVTVMKPVVS